MMQYERDNLNRELAGLRKHIQIVRTSMGHIERHIYEIEKLDIKMATDIPDTVWD